MNKSMMTSAVVGGIIVFVWGMLSWMILPWHKHSMMKFEHEESVAQVISANAKASGLYVLPNSFHHKEGMTREENEHQKMKAMQMMEHGPFMLASIRVEGMNYKSPAPYIVSLIIQIVSAFLITWLLLKTKGLSYMKQVGFITIVGLVAAILGYLPGWNWWGFPLCYTIVGMLDIIIGWFLAGLAIAKLAKR
jgi:hypothetical protein